MRSRKLALFLLAIAIVPNVGCQSWYGLRDTFYFCEPIDEAVLTYNCNRAAHAAWKSRLHRHCDRACVDHFGAGFRAGYSDVAMGGTGCPPPLPPRRYWGWRYQNCEGQQCVAGWFDGYPAGARAAEEDGVANWSRMQTSYLIDAQYAARMGKGRGAVAPVKGFPGEELEEVPANAANSGDTSVPVPAEADQAAPIQTPTAPAGQYAPEQEMSEEVGAIRKFESPRQVPVRAIKAAKVTMTPEPTAAASEPIQVASSAVRRIEASPSEASPAGSEPSAVQPEESVEPEVATVEPAAAEPATLRKLEMPAAEMLSGVGVPKKQIVNVEAAPEVSIAETTPIEATEEVPAESEDSEVVEAKALPPIVSVTKPVSSKTTGGVVAETPSYSLPSDSEPIPTAPAAKRTLPPIVPSKSTKKTEPLIRPIEEQGRMTKLEKPTATKQVSFESESGEEAPALRRIGTSK